MVIRSCISTSKPVHAGVPQGSVLGPLLFLIYVNDIAESLLSLKRLFADNISLFCSANHDLQILSAWAKQWLISFNALKIEAILFALKHFTDLAPYNS